MTIACLEYWDIVTMTKIDVSGNNGDESGFGNQYEWKLAYDSRCSPWVARDVGQERWRRFFNPWNDSGNVQSSPADCNRAKLLQNFAISKVAIGRSSHVRLDDSCRMAIQTYTDNREFVAKWNFFVHACLLSPMKAEANATVAEYEERATQHREQNTPLIGLIQHRTEEERIEVTMELLRMHPADVFKSASWNNKSRSYCNFPLLKLHDDMSLMFSEEACPQTNLKRSLLAVLVIQRPDVVCC